MHKTLQAAIDVIQAHPRFEELRGVADGYYPKITSNALTIVDKAITEDAYSRFLAYLLDSGQEHELATQFYVAWAARLGLPAVYYRRIVKVRCRAEWETHGGRFLDLLVEAFTASGNLLVVGIENKIGAPESPNQLGDYQEAISTAFRQASARTLVYLSPDARLPTTARLDLPDVPVLRGSYEAVRDSIVVVARANANLPVSRFLEQFAEFIDHRLMGREEYMDKAKEIVRDLVADPRTRKAIDLLRMAFVEDLTPRNLVYEKVLSGLRARYPASTVAWHYPSDWTRPREFNFDLGVEPAKAIKDEGYKVYLMSLVHVRNGELPKLGDAVRTYVMAYLEGAQHSKKARDEIRHKWKGILSQLPVAPGTPREWGPWICLWAGETRELQDMADKDGAALVSNLLDAARAIDGILVRRQ